LVLAAGSTGFRPNVPGLAEHAFAVEQMHEAIKLDPYGVNTESTVRNTMSLASGKPWRILAVSHFYHLPRIKLAYQRAGLEVCTVPARQKYFLSQIPYSMAREVAAFWVYYVKQRPAHAATGA